MVSCSEIEVVKTKDNRGKLVEEFEQIRKTKVRHGFYKSFFSDGTLNEVAKYKLGSLDGKRLFHYESGKLMSIEHHNNGLFSGKFQKFYEDGTKYVEGQYVNNEMSGVWKRWFPDGTLKEEATFEKNEENGPFKEYYENGKTKTEGQYTNGENEQGELKKYDQNGELFEKMYCEEGVCMTIWTKKKGEVPLDSTRFKRLVSLKKKLKYQ
jgi:antitoxin component YwqK of YwqJK toxin-antitoxin module